MNVSLLGPQWSRWRHSFSAPIVAAMALLLVLCATVAPGSIKSNALAAMLPFAAILAIAAVAQNVVAQQAGLDFSIGGVMSLVGVLVTRLPQGHADRLPAAVLLALGVALAIGLINGVLVNWFGIAPIVTTLAMNSIVVGVVVRVSHGFTIQAPSVLSDVAAKRVFSVPGSMWIALVVVVLAQLLLLKTKPGRQFTAVGAAPAAARAAGISVVRYGIATYMVSALLSGVAGILLAGYLRTPEPLAGNDYLLPTIAAVVLGGTSLAGGRSSLVATGVAALFLSQLNQFLATLGASTAVQLVVQGTVVAAGLALRSGLATNRKRKKRRRVDRSARQAAEQPVGGSSMAAVGPTVAAAASVVSQRSSRQ